MKPSALKAPPKLVKTNLLLMWGKITRTYWLLPSLMVFGSAVLAFCATILDAHFASDLEATGWWFLISGPEGSRSVITAIAGSMMTVAGVVFSSVMVVLTLASQQYGARLLRNFIKDIPSQIALGTFLATFVYSLLILKNIRSLEDNSFVPHISIILGVILALCSIGVFIHFIHHVSSAIQIQEIIRRVEGDLNVSLKRVFPSTLGKSTGHNANHEPMEEEAQRLRPYRMTLFFEKIGYVQAIREEIMDTFAHHDLYAELHFRPGQFIDTEDCCMSVYSRSPFDDEGLAEELKKLVILGDIPTHEQDAGFPINQLEEIAMRALSPGVNDPHTALECIDRMAPKVADMLNKPLPSPYRIDDQGTLRLKACITDAEEILTKAYLQIFHYGKDSQEIVCAVLNAVFKVGKSTEVLEHKK